MNQKWIKCSEKLPEKDQTVIASDGENIGEYFFLGDCFETDEGYRMKATHWMAMPELPKDIMNNEEEKVNHPSHYQGNGLEAKQVISAFDLNFSLGNSIKYILRCNKKGNKIEDLKKAIWYLNEEIEDCQKNMKD